MAYYYRCFQSFLTNVCSTTSVVTLTLAGMNYLAIFHRTYVFALCTELDAIAFKLVVLSKHYVLLLVHFVPLCFVVKFKASCLGNNYTMLLVYH